MDFTTLPNLAAAKGLNLDTVRKMVRTDPQLSTLGKKAGLTKVFSPAEAEQIVQAVAARRRPQAA